MPVALAGFGNTKPRVIVSDKILEELDIPITQAPPVLENIDYETWVEDNRGWFKQQFPNIFMIKDALAKDGIEVDYPELLIKTGDVWQFAHTKTTPDRFSVPSFNSLLKTVSGFGFDKQWLLNNVPLAKDTPEMPVLLKNSLTALAAFKRFNSSFEDAQKSREDMDFDTQIRLFHASIYLANTRSLIWFAVKDGKYNLTGKGRSEVLILLQSQVNGASVCRDNALYQLDKNKQTCDPEEYKQDKWYQWVDVIKRNITTITTAEEKIAKYELTVSINGKWQYNL